MTAAPAVAPTTLDAFLRILAAHRVGDPISSNGLREHLDNAHIPPRARGALFQHAIDAGYLTPNTIAVRSNGPRARGGLRRCYRLNKRPGVTK